VGDGCDVLQRGVLVYPQVAALHHAVNPLSLAFSSSEKAQITNRKLKNAGRS